MPDEAKWLVQGSSDERFVKITLHGGFGEKGRTCLSIAHDGFRLLLDIGINTSGQGADIGPNSMLIFEVELLGIEGAAAAAAGK